MSQNKLKDIKKEFNEIKQKYNEYKRKQDHKQIINSIKILIQCAVKGNKKKIFNDKEIKVIIESINCLKKNLKDI